MADEEGKKQEEELDEEVKKEAYPLSENQVTRIEGQELSCIVLVPRGMDLEKAPSDSELGTLLAKKEKELDTQKKLTDELTRKVTELTAQIVEFKKKVEEVENKEKASLAEELNAAREKVGFEKIEKPEELSREVLAAKLEDANALAKKLEKETGDPKPKTKKELSEGDKEAKKKELRKAMFGHEDPSGGES